MWDSYILLCCLVLDIQSVKLGVYYKFHLRILFITHILLHEYSDNHMIRSLKEQFNQHYLSAVHLFFAATFVCCQNNE